MTKFPWKWLVRLTIGPLVVVAVGMPLSWGPVLGMLVLGLSLGPLGAAWKGSRGLTLRPAVAWGILAVALGIIAEATAFSEPLGSGRPTTGHWAYLSSLATLAALISVLGARSPGGGAWAILMGLLVVVFLLPWLEGSGLAKGSPGLDRLRLDAPWSIFFGLLVLAGVTNYLPTRFSLSAGLIGASLLVELIGLVMTGWDPSLRARLWSAGPSLLGAGLLLGGTSSSGISRSGDPLTRLWMWFRDHWGVVWALRVRERFNRAAESARWPVRLSWQGPVSPEGGHPGEISEAASRTLATLLRRFADPDRIEAVMAGDASGACPPALLEGR